MELRIKYLACLIAVAAAGCASGPGGQRAATAPLPDPGSSEVSQLRARVARLEAELEQTRERAAGTELRRIEAEARLADLRNRHEDLSRAHDEAVAEVVRAQAKLRGSVSQADAASNIAEAEIALASLPDDSYMQARQARSLLQQATEQFAQENFGGALYLSSQAKRLLRNVGNGSMPLVPVEGEVAFGAPLPLKVSGNSNLRAGPGLEHPVLTTLAGGTDVEGYSYKDAWVRVRLADGTDGWVYQSLVAEREPAEE